LGYFVHTHLTTWHEYNEFLTSYAVNDRRSMPVRDIVQTKYLEREDQNEHQYKLIQLLASCHISETMRADIPRMLDPVQACGHQIVRE
jgi:hypothetical protein